MNDSELIPPAGSRCRTCRHFQRGNWHESQGGGEQSGGRCDLLQRVLGVDNPAIYMGELLYVQDTFGCVFYSENAKHIHTDD